MLKYNFRLISLLVFMCAGYNSFAQPGKDTSTQHTLADTILAQEKDNALDNIPIVSLDENDNQDGSAQNLSVISPVNRDPFLRAASFNFTAVRFRFRGYDSDMFSTNMNGAPMETLDNGFTPFGLWGGLNDVIVAKNRQNVYSMQAASFGFGAFGGSNYIDTRAFKQFKQFKIAYQLSNRNFMHKLAVTKSTGFDKKGWAFSVSGSRRWANEGFADGTYYDGWSFYAGVDKKINSKQIISLVAFATPTENGRQSSSVDEMRQIAGTNFYNSFWGYQNGKKRNSSIARSFQPFGILTHDWKISPSSSLVTAVSYTTGKRSVTALDWYNAADPRPDYYRYLPSYYEDSSLKAAMYQALSTDVNKRQVNWDALYNTNYGNVATINNANGIMGNRVTGRRSVYIVEERVVFTKRSSINTTFNTSINKNVDLSAGATHEAQKNNYYKKVEDLLGGNFYVDVNQFAERDFQGEPLATQNDINRPNRILRKGDRFGYDYDINIQKTSAWVQANVKFHSINFFVAGEHSFTRFWRTGYVRSGLFPNNSFGKSGVQDFGNYSFKSGAIFKIASGHFLFTNAGYQTRAPFFENSYLSPRTRDLLQDNLKSERVASVEAGYSLVAPIVKLRVTGFYSSFRNQLDVITFYDDFYRSFGNYSLSNIGKEHYGVEIGAEVNVYKGLTITAAASVGKYRYDTRSEATITVDNTSEILAQQKIYLKNFYLPVPQEVGSIGLNYRSPKFWYLNVNFNYFGKMWLAASPVRRSAAAVDGLEPGSVKWDEVIDQVSVKQQFSIDAFAGYSWLLNKRMKGLTKRTFLIFGLGMTNVLDNQDIMSGGFEQLRFDFEDNNSQKFPPRKFFSFGRTFSASVSLRF